MRQNIKPLLPELTNPMNETAKAFRLRLFEGEGIPEDHDLKIAIRGLSKIDEKIERVNDVREKIMADRTLNKDAKKAEFLKFVRKVDGKIQDDIQNVSRVIDRRTNEIAETVNRPISEEAGGRDASDIRKYVANLPEKSQRLDFIKKRIDANDFESASAALGSKFYLAGLDEKNQQNLLKYYREKRFDGLMKVNSGFEKIGKSVLKKVDIIGRFKKSIENPQTLAALESQKAREAAMK